MRNTVLKKSALETKAALLLANQISPKVVHTIGFELTSPHTSPRQLLWREPRGRATPQETEAQPQQGLSCLFAKSLSSPQASQSPRPDPVEGHSRKTQRFTDWNLFTCDGDALFDKVPPNTPPPFQDILLQTKGSWKSQLSRKCSESEPCVPTPAAP